MQSVPRMTRSIVKNQHSSQLGRVMTTLWCATTWAASPAQRLATASTAASAGRFHIAYGLVCTCLRVRHSRCGLQCIFCQLAAAWARIMTCPPGMHAISEGRQTKRQWHVSRECHAAWTP